MCHFAHARHSAPESHYYYFHFAEHARLSFPVRAEGEEDAGDNRLPPAKHQASYCTYLETDLGALVDHFRASFKGAAPGTPFMSGGMLPYWVDSVNGTEGVMSAIYAINTSRPCA